MSVRLPVEVFELGGEMRGRLEILVLNLNEKIARMGWPHDDGAVLVHQKRAIG